MANILSRISLAVPALSSVANLANIPPMIDMKQKYEHYRVRFVEAFKARKLTNEEFGERIKAHSVTVSKLRNGKIHLDDEWRVKVAAALDIPEDVLFGEEPLPAPGENEIFISPKKALKIATKAKETINALSKSGVKACLRQITTIYVSMASPRDLLKAPLQCPMSRLTSSLVHRHLRTSGAHTLFARKGNR